MTSMRRTFARYGRWLLAAMLVTAIVVAVTGWWPIAVYSAINLIGLVLYLDGISPRHRGGEAKHRWFPLLAIVLLPIGIYGVLASNGSTPSDGMRGDPNLRDDVARSTRPATGGEGAGMAP